MKRAYFVEVDGWRESRGVTAATSYAQAKYHGFLAAKDAGYNVGYDRFRASRAPQYDVWAEVATNNSVLTIEVVTDAVERAQPIVP